MWNATGSAFAQTGERMKISQAEVAQQYQTSDNLNARIALHRRFHTNPYSWFRWLFDHFVLPADARILELGCGSGLLWYENRDRILPSWKFTLTDFSPGMVTEASHKLEDILPAADFQLVDAQEIPFSADHFDLVIANHMLYHLPDRERALAECRRVLKPSGRCYASTVGETHMLALWELVERFDPGVMAQRPPSVSGFTLENGQAQLAAHFDKVERYIYADELQVTEVAPLVDYLLSSDRMTDYFLAPGRKREFSELVAHCLAAAEGTLRIQKSLGLFEALS